jgi:hypothetical protein
MTKGENVVDPKDGSCGRRRYEIPLPCAGEYSIRLLVAPHFFGKLSALRIQCENIMSTSRYCDDRQLSIPAVLKCRRCHAAK